MGRPAPLKTLAAAEGVVVQTLLDPVNRVVVVPFALTSELRLPIAGVVADALKLAAFHGALPPAASPEPAVDLPVRGLAVAGAGQARGDRGPATAMRSARKPANAPTDAAPGIAAQDAPSFASSTTMRAAVVCTNVLAARSAASRYFTTSP